MSVCRVHSPKKETVLVVIYLLIGALLASAALWNRAEHLETRRALLTAQENATRLESTGEYWKEKYNALRYARQLTPAQRALVRKWEKMQLK